MLLFFFIVVTDVIGLSCGDMTIKTFRENQLRNENSLVDFKTIQIKTEITQVQEKK